MLTPLKVGVIMREYKIMHADVILKCDATEDELIDVIEGNRQRNLLDVFGYY